MGRTVYTIEDDEDIDLNQYDGRSRLIAKVDTTCDCANTQLYHFDDNNNLVKTITIDKPSHGHTVNGVLELFSFVPPLPETFTSYTNFDALNRPVMSTSALRTPSQNGLNYFASYTKYDSRNNVIATADSNGPDDAYTLTSGDNISTNSHGNVNKLFYDIASRSIKTEAIMTANGLGNGSFTPSPDPAQAGGDGLIRSTQEYDLNSRLLGKTDDNSNLTGYSYDELNRRTFTNYADGTTDEWIYDKDHNVAKRIDEKTSFECQRHVR